MAGIGWPKEWGGQGKGPIEQFIFFDESMRAGAPVPMLTVNTVGPTIMEFGTQEQKEFFLPKILAGDIHFCIGYTEPESGTDLASLQTRAVRDGDEYVINGQKIYTSLAGDADYIWLATRTDPEAAKHKGISMFVVPMDTPGIKVVPMRLPATTTSTTPSTRTSGSRRRTSSVGRTRAGRSSPTSSTTSGSPCARRGSSSGRSTTSGRGPSRPSWPTAAG